MNKKLKLLVIPVAAMTLASCSNTTGEGGGDRSTHAV